VVNLHHIDAMVEVVIRIVKHAAAHDKHE
jgi:hypothetical protein